MPDYYKLRIKEIADLSKTFRVWKIHWIGQCSINSVTGEMVIDVYLVPMLDSKKFLNGITDPSALVYNGKYKFGQAKIIKIGIGQLPLLRIGAMYVDGYPYKYPEYITANFTLPVTEKNQEIISLGKPLGNKEKSSDERTCYYIPTRQYQVFLGNNDVTDIHSVAGHKKPFKSKCLVVDFPAEKRPEVSLDTYPLNLSDWKNERGTIKNNKPSPTGHTAEVHGLIIPCIEMIRFYYTNSSQLCREMIFGGLDRNRVFVAEKTVRPSDSNPDGFLMLSKFVRNRDAPIIARFAFDDYAMSQARYIYISSVNNLMAEKAALPEARFPFKDVSTDLIVHGTYLQSGDEIYFMVFWIQSCSAEFPFENVEYWRTNPGTANAPKTDRNDITQPESSVVEDENGRVVPGGINGNPNVLADHIKTARNFDTIEAQSEEIPSGVRRQIDLLLKEEQRFPDLDNHTIEPRKPQPEEGGERIIHESQTSIINPGGKEDEIVGTAPGGGIKPVTPVSLTPDILPSDPDKLDDLTEENIYDPESDLPDLTPFFSDENSFDEDIPDNDFTDDFPVSDRKPRAEALPIDIDVFKEILGWIKKLQPDWNARMIEVPPDRPLFNTRKASPFPLTWEELEKLPAHLPHELFIAEIKMTNNRYAYLMDIEAKSSGTGKSQRSFTMFLCLKKNEPERLREVTLRYVLQSCAKNGGKWFKATTASDDYVKKSEYLYRCSLKHTRKSEKDYAQDVIKAINTGIAFRPGYKNYYRY